MKKPHPSTWKQRAFRVTLSKKILLGFILAVVIAIAAFHLLPLRYAVLVILVLAVVIYLLVDRDIIRPIQALTLSVIESRPTQDGFEYKAPDIHTGDELELLSDAIRRMAADMNRKD